MSKSSTFLISDLISEQKNLLNPSNNNILDIQLKNSNPYQFLSNLDNSYLYDSNMKSSFINKTDEFSNSRTSFSSQSIDTPSSSSSSIVSSNLRQDDYYNQINEYIIRNKSFSNLKSHENFNNVDSSLVHSINKKYCNCMACNAVRFFSLVNPNFNAIPNRIQENLPLKQDRPINELQFKNKIKKNFLGGKINFFFK